MALEKRESVSDATMVQVVGSGDLAALSPAHKVEYYNAVCRSTGLNPLTKPFDFLTFKGRTVLYPNRNCVDQLVGMKGLSVDYSEVHEDKERKLVIQWATVGSGGRSLKDVAILSTQETDKQGKVYDITGQDYGNLLMKLLTKCRRRAVLAFCGLPYDGVTLDDEGAIKAGVVQITTPTDAELADLAPVAELLEAVSVDTSTGEIIEPKGSDPDELLDDLFGPSKMGEYGSPSVNSDAAKFATDIIPPVTEDARAAEVTIPEWDRLTEEIQAAGLTVDQVLPKGMATWDDFQRLGGTVDIARIRLSKLVGA